MNNRITLSLCAALLAACTLVPSAAWALGLGANFTYAYRTGTWGAEDVADFSSNNYPDLDFSANDINVGFTLDTAVAKDKLFNYRLNLNYAHSWLDVPGVPNLSPNAETISDGVNLENVFGFGVMRRPNLRWWVGPMFRLSFARARSTDPGAAQYLDSPQIDVGAGLVTGVNLHKGKRISMGMTLGYDINWSMLEFPEPIEIQYFGPTHRVSVGVTVLYRLGNDAFERSESLARRH